MHMDDTIATLIREEFAKLREEMITYIDSKLTERDDSHTQQQNQLQLATRQTMAMVGEKIQADVYNDIMREINTNIAPKVNQAMSWINHNMTDGGELVDEYRREVEKQSFGDNLMITDGAQDKRVISAQVRTYFGNDSSDDEY